MPLDETAAILILESEPLIAIDIEEMLRMAGFAHVAHAASVSDAGYRLKEQHVGLVILDLYALDGSTASFASQLSCQQIPIVVCSGLARHEAEPDFPVAGAVWLSKPCSASELVAAVHAASGLAT